jgi:uncharacterized protein YjbI with pentapeptide repeats
MIKSNSQYSNKKFIDIKPDLSAIENTVFENCSFINCNFDDLSIKKCKFSECTFKSCSLNLVKFTGSSFLETEFFDSKMKGINWTEINLPLVIITSAVFFNSCDLSYSTFYELKLPGIIMVLCKAHDVDFRMADLSNADLSGSDFKNAQFNKTNLKSADLRESINYRINPIENIVTNAHFSFPEVVALLQAFKIKIDDLE